jgi:hypothetical protein
MAGMHDHTSENTMSDANNGCESSAMLSRRGFLKGIGALALGAVAAKAVVAPEVTEAVSQRKRDFDRAVGIALSSKLFKQAVHELRDRGFVVKISQGFNQDTFLRSESTPHLVGIVTSPLEDAQRNQNSTGIIVTVDMNAGNVFGVTYNIIRVNSDSVEIESIVISRDRPREEKRRNVNISDENQTGLKSIGRLGQQGEIAALDDCYCGQLKMTSTCCNYGQCFGGYQCTHLSAYRYNTCTGDACEYKCMYVGCP